MEYIQDLKRFTESERFHTFSLLITAFVACSVLQLHLT